MAQTRHTLRALVAGAVLFAAAAPTPAFAQPTSSGKVTAEALFVEGRRLVAAGQYADACPKFADSQRLDPSPATLLNLASCYEKLERTATAWATYREAASAASAAGRQEFVATAQRHADALLPHLSRLTLSVARPVDGIEIKRDNVVVDRAEWGTPIPLDPGAHTLVASAPGYKPWSGTIEVPREAGAVTAAVPVLDPLPKDGNAPVEGPGTVTGSPAPAAQAPPAGAQPASAGAAPPPGPPAEGSTSAGHGDRGAGQRIAGWTVAGAGVVSLAVGVGFTIAAKSKYDQSLNNCEAGANHNLCSPTGVSERNDARTSGDVASWTVGVGAVLAAAGLVVVLTAPHEPKGERTGTSWVLTPTLGGASMEGTW